jgi:Zn-dependent protease with chaperone function
MFLYFIFLLASLVVVVGTWQLLAQALSGGPAADWLAECVPGVMDWLRTYQLLAQLPLLALLGAYVFIVFGFLSRRCERQADIYGCRTVSVPVFIDALEKVARINGISRDRPGWLSSWQHSTIALRVEFLERMHADPALEPHFQRRVGLVKWGMLLGLAAGVAGLVVVLGENGFREILKHL